MKKHSLILNGEEAMEHGTVRFLMTRKTERYIDQFSIFKSEFTVNREWLSTIGLPASMDSGAV